VRKGERLDVAIGNAALKERGCGERHGGDEGAEKYTSTQCAGCATEAAERWPTAFDGKGKIYRKPPNRANKQTRSNRNILNIRVFYEYIPKQ
jgi:hypothetical protein